MGRFERGTGELRRAYEAGPGAGAGPRAVRRRPPATAEAGGGARRRRPGRSPRGASGRPSGQPARLDGQPRRPRRAARAADRRRLVLAAARARSRWPGDPAAIVGQLSIVIVPLAIALLLSALLAPAGRLRCCAARLPRSLATALVLVGRAGRGGRHADPGGQRVHRRRAGPDRERRRGHPADPGLAQDRPAAPVRQPARPRHRRGAGAGSTTTPSALTSGASSTATTVGRGAHRRCSWCSSRRSSSCATAARSGGSWSGCCRAAPAGKVDDAGRGVLGDPGRLRAGHRAGRVHRRGRHRRLSWSIFDVPFAFPLAALVFLGAFIPIVGATALRRGGGAGRAGRQRPGHRADHARRGDRRAAARGPRPAAADHGPGGGDPPARRDRRRSRPAWCSPASSARWSRCRWSRCSTPAIRRLAAADRAGHPAGRRGGRPQAP